MSSSSSASLQDHTGDPSGALWQPHHDTLPLWDELKPGMDILIEKQFPDPGREPVRYDATVMETSVPSPWVETRGIWTFDTVEVSGLVYERDGELREFFSPRHPFNVFAIYGVDGAFRGWYGNVTWPARAYRDGDTLVLAWPDLILDLILLADGSLALLDDDELEDSGLRDTAPWLTEQIVSARDELLRLLRAGFFPTR